MKSRKKKSLPTRAKRYKKKLSTSLDYNNLEARHLLAADAMPTINFVGTTDLVVLNDPIALNEGADLMRSQLQLGENESLKLSRVWTDQLGFEHFKYKQYFNDIVVQGSNYTLHVQDSQIVSMSGDQVAVENPIVGIQISSETALEHAKDHIGSEKYAWQDEFTSELLGLTGEPEGELVYITGDTGASIPTYKFDMYTLDLGSRDYVYVNANSGAIEATESRIRHGDVDAVGDTHYYGTVEFIADEVSDTEYRLRQVTDGVETYDNQTNPSNDFANAIDIIASAPVFDAPAQYSGVSAHWGAENTLSLFEDWFGRDSYDDEGATLVSYVNVNQNWNNATWNGSVMQYGEGDGNILGPLVEIDIVAHEITHGVTEYSADLVYAYEPGALNESFSDIFGEVVEYFALGENDWIAGDNAWLGEGGIRSFIDPSSGGGGPQPDTYMGENWWTSPFDNGGVHFNSGVQNKWFYILSHGEEGTNDNGEDYDVAGIGIEDAAQIAYRNLTTYLGQNSQYQTARDGAVQAAIDIYGKNSEQHKQTDAAWKAVGVYPLDVVFESESLEEVVPGSMIFTGEQSGFIPDFGPRGVSITLDPGQTLTVVVEGKNGVAPSFELFDPNEAVIATADANGFQAMVDSVAVDSAGLYRLEVNTANGIVGDFDVRVVLNATLENELIQTSDNGLLATAQDIENSVLQMSELSAEHLGLVGGFEISEIPSFVSEDFESGSFGSGWSTSSTTPDGRIQILDQFAAGEGDFALYMDTTNSGFENQNEAIWTVDLTTVDTPFLNFYYASFNDENTELPVSFNGTINGDGVSVSQDGVTWYTVHTDSVTRAGEWNQFSLRLDQFAETVGIELTSTFQIKFQQYDDDLLGSDGRAYDGISITSDAISEDWYSFELNEGEVSTIAVGKKFISGSVDLELYDKSGNLVATGAPSGDLINQINQFVAAETDTYFARLVGSATPYGLVVTRGADFDIGSTELEPQDISGPRAVIGFVDTVANIEAEPDVADDKVVLDEYFEGVTLSNNITGGSVYAVRTSFEAPSGVNVFAPSPTGGSGWQGGVDELRADFAIPQTYVSILVGAEESAQDIGFLRAYDIEGNEIDRAFSRRLEPGETQTIWVTSASRAIAYVVAGGFQNDITPLDKLTYEIAQDSNDYYSFEALPNQVVSVDVSFPGGGPFLFENTLTYEFKMDLLDSDGQVVASGVNQLDYYTASGGEYVVRVSARAGEGDYHLKVTAETQTGSNQTYFSLGYLGEGVAVDDFAVGNGYLMYSVERLPTRFSDNPPLYRNADHVIAVRFENGLWEYNDNTLWHAFTPVEGDRLIAKINFDTDRIDSLEGLTGIVHGIEQGFYSSDVSFKTNTWKNKFNVGEFEVKGTHFYVGDRMPPATIGDYGLGIGVHDAAVGIGYILHSESNVFDRFAGDPPRAEGALNMVAVQFDTETSRWRYSNNSTWVEFTPNETDRLIAGVNFDDDTIDGLDGYGGKVNGINQGYFDSDLEFVVNRWDDDIDIGEFQVTGTFYTTDGISVSMGYPGQGIAVDDAATGTGYMMYSEEVLKHRFSDNPPWRSTSTNAIAVRFDSGNWQYNDNLTWHNFTPVSTDRLIATIDYDSNAIHSLEGAVGSVNGIIQGYFDSDLTFVANSWGGRYNPAEFQILGTSFIQ